jgi:hypothetical protein
MCGCRRLAPKYWPRRMLYLAGRLPIGKGRLIVFLDAHTEVGGQDDLKNESSGLAAAARFVRTRKSNSTTSESAGGFQSFYW